MAIFVLEDQVIQATYLQQLIQKILLGQNNNQEEVHVCYRGKDLIEAARQSIEPNLYFLDIRIKEDAEAGLKIAASIREFDPDGIIAFVTTYKQLALKSYEYLVSALTFIDKNVDSNQFQAQIQRCIEIYLGQEAANSEELLVLDFLSPPLHIAWSKLNYFEVVGNHTIRVNTHQRFMEFYGTLTDIEALDPRLIRLHQAFLVNKEQIYLFNPKKKHVQMLDGTMIPVTRTYYKRIGHLLQPFEGEEL